MGKVCPGHPGAGIFSIVGARVMGRLRHLNALTRWQAEHLAVCDVPARPVSGFSGPVAMIRSIRSGPRRHDGGRRLCVVPIDWKGRLLHHGGRGSWRVGPRAGLGIAVMRCIRPPQQEHAGDWFFSIGLGSAAGECWAVDGSAPSSMPVISSPRHMAILAFR